SLRTDLAARPVAHEGDHQRMRERPRLAGEVADVAYSHADLLGHLALQALLERLAGLDEAGERAVHPGREVRAAREEELALPLDERHDGGRHSRIGGEPACRADAAALLPPRLGAGAAAAAELVRAVPVDELQGAPGEREVRVLEHREERAQPLPAQVLGRRRRPFRELGGPAVDVIETP